MKKSGFVIAAASSGSGKTTFALGLMRSLRNRGLRVGPFKCGPDYIDTQFHRVAAGRDSINLDTFMASEGYVAGTYRRYGSETDVNVVEGVMGMFDGYERMQGSSADIARLLDLPVILIVNAASTAYSVAATIYGFSRYREDVRVAGVVFNRVASENHFRYLKDACRDAGVECLGYIGRSDSLRTPSRHLGLTLSGFNEMETFVKSAAEAVEAHVDINRLLEVTEYNVFPPVDSAAEPLSRGLRVAVASDEAFNFIYPENIRALGQKDVIFFSPLRDHRLPDGADLVYLPGGYPELFAKELEANSDMRRSVREYVERGGNMWAECGGMIYLTRDIDGVGMCGVIPTSTTMHDAGLALGYRVMDLDGLTLRGHEFHYSRLMEPDVLPSVAVQRSVTGRQVATPLYKYKNTYAGYTHIYWGESGILRLWNL